MAVPKRKVSRSRRGKRRAHQHLVLPSLSPCPRCRSPKRPHRVCPNCGYYKNKSFLKVEEK
ncbi:MAG: 50S ribosomal protein L32 [Thermodesulfobacteriaceae bacterium]|nr:50S ribosomal protein L32 [Thermodesulfobacteriaceae bacterium]MCX8040945.1 50S ribosomal protein L32 [Thermodesulfobacteriaceae bacterium]MDW8135699.1 50S ribosomal protein L32 [Thermodesulfobacterium sp.]